MTQQLPLDATASCFEIVTSGWPEIVAAQHGAGLTLPDGAGSRVEVVPEELRDKLSIQSCCEPLLGTGQDGGGETVSLSDTGQAWRVHELVELLREHAASVRQLGLTLERLLAELAALPEGESEALGKLLTEKLPLATPADVLATRSALAPDGLAAMSDPAGTVSARGSATMSMFPFHATFTKVALRETRNLTTLADRDGLPADTYELVELYCVEAGCDCRRVMLNVLAGKSLKHVATINYGFDPDDDMRGPFLDPLNVQSDLSPALLMLVQEDLDENPAYVRRLERHYRMVKDALADPGHQIHRRMSRGPTSEEELAQAVETFERVVEKTGRNEPCPCGSGKKFKRCCLRTPAPQGGER